ncbi:uncharacterized protein C8A04DRAFT_29488 [Dichotomopilus funicola]|uniref:Zn(2)-C6 fungal-type domain-containing protein n=1 Tax=Dichotomopilus funicola TaxID=1934379 RepID=A0AAN6ZMR2_9PEZI|nr:hypothetical protein C8A04DRAFT_29488 [Dichotomopilus funicola]
METRSVRARVANACDLCKLRKIKCSGAQPCTYCARRRQPDQCRYTAPRRRLGTRSHDATTQAHATSASPSSSTHLAPSTRSRPAPPAPGLSSSHHPTPAPVAISQAANTASPRASASLAPPPRPTDAAFAAAYEEHEETEVPREARLLCDAQGKLIFVGDCAPLSFFQSVRRLVTNKVDASAFAPETSGYSSLENAYSRTGKTGAFGGEPPPVDVPIEPCVAAYLDVTAGLIDLFDNAHLADDIASWIAGDRLHDGAGDVPSAVNYLVLAIGCQKSDEHTAQAYFDYARNLAFTSLGGNVGVAGVQAFILISFYSLSACQINGAFLFFGIAARAAYSIGIHRTAVNARFGPEIHRQRDRLWKSLRVLDLFLSTSMGRPPATSDVDCTVPYGAQDEAGLESFDLLNASVQIFLVIEAVVMEVYSRRKISPRLTEGISRELRDWSTRWLQRLKDIMEGGSSGAQGGIVNGACQVVCTYYYAVILVSRPFFMVEVHSRLSEGSTSAYNGLSTKSKLAEACVDAAILMVEPVRDAIEQGSITQRAPVIVSWVFASSLVLGLGLLGGFGRILEKHCRASIAVLQHFSKSDAHAVQYSLIAKSLLSTALKYLEKREIQERQQRTESSSQLFGLIPRTPRSDSNHGTPPPGSWRSDSPQKEVGRSDKTRSGFSHSGPEARFNFDFESTFLGLGDTLPKTPDFSLAGGPLDVDAEQTFGALNLFPLLETDGHIDLANYF